MQLPVMVANVRAAGERTVEIQIHDVIGKSAEKAGVTSGDVARMLTDAGDVERIIVSINSVGGSAFDGVAIYNLLSQHPARVTVRIDGLAASAASIIAMAGDEIEMPASAWMLIHNPTSRSTGGAKQHRKAAEILDSIANSAVRIYQGRTGRTESQLRDWMEAETWIDAQQALESGFCTRVLETEATVTACLDLTPFACVPAAVANLVQAKLMAEPEGQAGPMISDGRIQVAELDRYVTVFGATNGLQWLRDGKPFVDCLTLETSRLKAELEAIEDRHRSELAAERERTELAWSQIEALDRGEPTPVPSGDASKLKATFAGAFRMAASS